PAPGNPPGNPPGKPPGNPPPAPPGNPACAPAKPNWSYCAFLFASPRMSCAACTSLYFASASLSPGLRSGWYFFDSLRYALLISSAVADFETPSTSYGSRGMVAFMVVVVGRTRG